MTYTRTWVQCYRTFSFRNLRVFVMSQSVLSLSILSSLVKYLWVRPGACPSKAPPKFSTLGRLLALPTNMTLGWRYLLGTNTIAYYEHSQVTEEKSFITGVNVIRLFSLSRMVRQNKLECLSLSSFFRLVQYLPVRSTHTLKMGHRQVLHLGRIRPYSQTLDYPEKTCQEQTLQLILSHHLL